MDPIATTDHFDFSPLHVAAVVLVAIGIGVAGMGLRKFVELYADELSELWRQYGPIAMRRLLEHRPAMPATPWFCDQCRSHNARGTSRCYACGATREAHEAPVPDAEVPAGPSAGLAQRTRRNG